LTRRNAFLDQLLAALTSGKLDGNGFTAFEASEATGCDEASARPHLAAFVEAGKVASLAPIGPAPRLGVTPNFLALAARIARLAFCYMRWSHTSGPIGAEFGDYAASLGAAGKATLAGGFCVSLALWLVLQALESPLELGDVLFANTAWAAGFRVVFIPGLFCSPSARTTTSSA